MSTETKPMTGFERGITAARKYIEGVIETLHPVVNSRELSCLIETKNGVGLLSDIDQQPAGPDGRQRAIAEVEVLRDKVDGLESDLDSALDVLVRRINGDADLVSAHDWLVSNYPGLKDKLVERAQVEARETTRDAFRDECERLADEGKRLKIELETMRQRAEELVNAERDKADELQATFDLQYKAEMRAVALWRSAGFGSELVLPDRTNLVMWLLSQVEVTEARLKTEIAASSAFRGGMVDALLRVSRLEREAETHEAAVRSDLATEVFQ